MEYVSLETISETCVPMKADEAVPSGEEKEGNTEKSISGDEVLLPESYLSTLPTDSCKRDSVLCGEPGATLHHTDPVLSTREDANSNGSSRKGPRKRGKRKKKKEKMLDNAEQVHQPKITLSYSLIQEGSHEHAQDSRENPGAAQLCSGPNLSTLEESQPDGTMMTSSQKRKKKGKKDKKMLKEIGVEVEGLEAKTVASVVINSCVKAKDNTVEQQEGTNVKINESVSQTQSPEAKKRKKRKTKTIEDCDPLGNTLATSIQSRPVKEVNEDVVGAGLCDVRTKKQKQKKKKKTSSADHKTAAMVGEDTTCKTEISGTTENSKVQNPGKRNARPEDATVESNQDAVGAEGVTDVGRKRKKRKKNKNENSESVAYMDTESVQCLSHHSNREGVENCDGNADREIASNATEDKSVQIVENINKEKEYKNGEDDQDPLGAEGVSKVEVKTEKKKKSNKKKNSLDLKADNMEEKKDDVSVPRDDEEPEFDRKKVETSLSSFDFVHNVAEGQTGDLPRCSCEGQNTKKLVVFDLNGILADIVQGDTGEFVPDGKISYRSVFRRPFIAPFLDVCFEIFEVGIWSSRRIGLDYMTNVVMRNHAKNLLFCFDQNICITTNFKTQDDRRKPVFLKDLRRVWNRFGRCFTCGKRKYDETNTLLVDDSPHKALCNPPHTGIFPSPYQYTDLKDSSLGPRGELRQYLERLADAENVQKFVEENPFGQTAITETHKSWEYYAKVIEAYK